MCLWLFNEHSRLYLNMSAHIDAHNEDDIILTASGLFYRRAVRGDSSPTHTAVTFIHQSANAIAESDGGSWLAAALHRSVT